MLDITMEGGVGVISLARPEKHNAFNGELVQLLMDAISTFRDDDRVRVVLIRSEGTSFCAGADLAWMQGMVDRSEDENRKGAFEMGAMFRALDSLPKPVVCRVQGAAIGGGVGLVACADIVVSSTRAKFGLSEVRLGLAPAVISPFVVRKMGEGQARRYFLTGERFDASRALSLGLIHEVVQEESLDEAVDGILRALLLGGPCAQSASKMLSRETRLDEPELDALNADVIARLRVSAEGQDGLKSFFSKASPAWVKGEGA